MVCDKLLLLDNGAATDIQSIYPNESRVFWYYFWGISEFYNVCVVSVKQGLSIFHYFHFSEMLDNGP